MLPISVVRRLQQLRLQLEDLAPGTPHRLGLATIDEARELIDEVVLLLERRGDPYGWATDVGFGDPQAVEVYEDHLNRHFPDAACPWSSLRPSATACKRRSVVGGVEKRISGREDHWIPAP